MITPPLCGSYQTQALLTPWSEPLQSLTDFFSFQITKGPGGGSCPSGPLPFAPSLAAGTTNIQAGAFSPLSTTISREDGNQDIQTVQLHMPPGLSGILTGIPFCPEAEANAGTCPEESLIGETIVSVGVGGDPFSVKGGKVYITGQYAGGSFGLSIVNPVKAGPFVLSGNAGNGTEVVRASIAVDPHTAQLTVSTDNSGPYEIPSILQGIPLQIQHVNVVIDRAGFTLNPTSCNTMAIGAILTSAEGATASLSVPFQVANCASLKFKPAFSVSTQGKTSKASGASLVAKLSYPSGSLGTQANIKSVKVALPKSLPSRLTTLQKACTAQQFDSNPAGCPAASLIGHAVVHTQLLPVPLSGPAYFVSHGGEAFPNLIIVLQGYGVTVQLVGDTLIKGGVTSSTFKATPDVPFESFELNLPEGPFSALAANGNLCSQKLVMPTEFVAQNGAVLNQNTHIEVEGCEFEVKVKSGKCHSRDPPSQGNKRGQRKR